MFEQMYECITHLRMPKYINARLAANVYIKMYRYVLESYIYACMLKCGKRNINFTQNTSLGLHNRP